MSLSFVKTAVLSLTDGISRNEKTSIDSNETQSLRASGGGRRSSQAPLRAAPREQRRGTPSRRGVRNASAAYAAPTRSTRRIAPTSMQLSVKGRRGIMPIGITSEPEKKTILMGHKISSFYAPSTQVFSHLFYFDRIKFL